MPRIISIYLTSEETERMDRLIREFNVAPSQILRSGLAMLFKETFEKENVKEASQPQAKPRAQKMVLDLTK